LRDENLADGSVAAGTGTSRAQGLVLGEKDLEALQCLGEKQRSGKKEDRWDEVEGGNREGRNGSQVC